MRTNNPESSALLVIDKPAADRELLKSLVSAQSAVAEDTSRVQRVSDVRGGRVNSLIHDCLWRQYGA